MMNLMWAKTGPGFKRDEQKQQERGGAVPIGIIVASVWWWNWEMDTEDYAQEGAHKLPDRI